MQGELKYSSDGQPLHYYYPELPSIGNMAGHAVQQPNIQSNMQFNPNNSSSATSNNGLISSSLHQMHHSINGNGVINVHGSASPDHQINSNSPNSTKKKRKSLLH